MSGLAWFVDPRRGPCHVSLLLTHADLPLPATTQAHPRLAAQISDACATCCRLSGGLAGPMWCSSQLWAAWPLLKHPTRSRFTQPAAPPIPGPRLAQMEAMAWADNKAGAAPAHGRPCASYQADCQFHVEVNSSRTMHKSCSRYLVYVEACVPSWAAAGPRCSQLHGPQIIAYTIVHTSVALPASCSHTGQQQSGEHPALPCGQRDTISCMQGKP